MRNQGAPCGHSRRLLTVVWLVMMQACAPTHDVPQHPTWAEVEPILRAECTSCHGGSAPLTGSAQGITYRLDFYDMTRDSCGDATLTVPATRFAAAASSQIATDITTVNPLVRPRMPPAPAPWLAEWEWQTLLEWASAPVKGAAPATNQPPQIKITSPTRVVKKHFTLSAVLSDPEGASAVAVLTIGDVTLRMDRPGAFAIAIDASNWGFGRFEVHAVVCDGWTSTAYDLGYFVVSG